MGIKWIRSNMSMNSHNPCVFDDPKNFVGVPQQESSPHRIITSEVVETEGMLEITVHRVHNKSDGITKFAKRFIFKMHNDEETPYLVQESNIDSLPWMNEVHTAEDFDRNPLNPLVHPLLTPITDKGYIGKNIWFIDETKIWVMINEIWIQTSLGWLAKIELSGDHRLDELIAEWKMYKNLGTS